MKIKRIILISLIFMIAGNGITGGVEVGFNYFKEDVGMVQISGNFGLDGRILFLPMLQVSDFQWTLTLELDYGIYYYRYYIDKQYWRLDDFIEETIVIPAGPIQGKFTLLKVLPADYEGYINLYKKYSEKGRLDWAKDFLVSAVKHFPRHIETYEYLGKLYEQMGHYGFAADAYLAGIEKAPQNKKFYYLLAVCYEKLYTEHGKSLYRKKARMYWEELLETAPYSEEAEKYMRMK
ncbi:MAG: hypothetical protein ABIH89_00470 [Elusimicrobiota bacterium]